MNIPGNKLANTHKGANIKSKIKAFVDFYLSSLI